MGESDLFSDYLLQGSPPLRRNTDSDTHSRLIETLITGTLAGIGSLGRRATTFPSSFRSVQLRNYDTREGPSRMLALRE